MGNDVLWKAAVIALGVAAAWSATKRYVASVRDVSVPPGIHLQEQYREHGPEQYDASLASLHAFASVYRSTFTLAQCTRESVEQLHALRDSVLCNLRELRLRMHNDLVEEAGLVQHTEDVDRLLRGYIEDAQWRSHSDLVFPGPIDDWFYRKFYRASNDVIE